MNNNIQELKPQNVWKHFAELCKLPHPSKHEEKVREYIVDFAARNGIDCRVDDIGNVILSKPATSGMEDRAGMVMQAHLDMVPQKNSDKRFDFLTDPIPVYIDGDWVTADGTTLGADNGLGVAAALAVMEDNELPHGYLEALFTVDEEAGMTGAQNLKAGELKADILLNLDSEEEGELYVGCAGGQDVRVVMPFEREAVPEESKGYRIRIAGLSGGHSGLEIILQRANSNKLMARFLDTVSQEVDIRLASINGGDMRNAIPREAEAVVAVPALLADAFEEKFEEYRQIVTAEYKTVDPGIIMTLEPAELPETVIDEYSQYTFVYAAHACPNGVDRMSDTMPGLVETSSNMGIVKTGEEHIEVMFLVRSSVDSAKEDLCERIASLFTLAGADVEFGGGYGGWNPNPDSPILKVMSETYRRLFGKTPEIKAIHAGLECGMFGAVYPEMDMISFGPTLRYPHSPDEKAEIASVDKFYRFLTETVKNAPKKR